MTKQRSGHVLAHSSNPCCVSITPQRAIQINATTPNVTGQQSRKHAPISRQSNCQHASSENETSVACITTYLGSINTEARESNADQIGEEVSNTLLHVLLLGVQVNQTGEPARVQVQGVSPGVERSLAVEICDWWEQNMGSRSWLECENDM